MANTFTNLVPVIVSSMARVGRQTGFAFNLLDTDLGADRAGVGQTVKVGRTVARSAYTVTPGPTPPALLDLAPENEDVVISEYKGQRFHLTGEEMQQLANGEDVRMRHIDQAIADVLEGASSFVTSFLNAGAGYAIGTAGTNPFASNPNAVMDVWQALADNKAPDMDRLLSLNTTSYAAAGKLAQFQKLNEAPIGTDFASGRIGMLGNFMVGYDQAQGTHTKGTGSGYLVNNGAGYAIGATAIAVDTGTGTILPGDVITFAADSVNKYVVRSFAGSVITLNSGLKVAIPDNNAITLANNHAVNIATQRGAGIIVARPPIEAPGGDQATEVEVITDPTTGLSMRLAYYPGYHAGQYEVSMVYGCGWRRREWAVKLMG